MKKILLFFLPLLFSCENLLFEEEPPNRPETNFDVFWKEFDRHYSFFDLKQIDWDSVYALHRPGVTATTTDRELHQILAAITLSLEDTHTGLYSPLGNVWYTETGDSPLNDGLDLSGYLSDVINSKALNHAMITDQNIGYIKIPSFSGSLGQSAFGEIDHVLEKFTETDGIIIDVRSNGGGSDTNSKLIAGRFTTEKRAYRQIKWRNGPDHTDFTDWIIDHFNPGGEPYLKPVVVLTNRKCFSTTEDFVLAMNVLPQVTIIGDTTGGGSGNPIFRELPNGWGFQLSNWISSRLDGFIYESTGLPPDVPVWITEQDSIAGTDTILESGIEYILNSE